MRADLMEILVCPVCKGQLTLGVEQTETPVDGREEIIAGTLGCAACEHSYRIDGGIPNLLPPEVNEALEATRAQSADLHP